MTIFKNYLLIVDTYLLINKTFFLNILKMLLPASADFNAVIEEASSWSDCHILKIIFFSFHGKVFVTVMFHKFTMTDLGMVCFHLCWLDLTKL